MYVCQISCLNAKKFSFLPPLAPDQFISAALPAPDAAATVKIVDLQFALIMAVGIGTADLFLVSSIRSLMALSSPRKVLSVLFFHAHHFLLNADGSPDRPPDTSRCLGTRVPRPRTFSKAATTPLFREGPPRNMTLCPIFLFPTTRFR